MAGDESSYSGSEFHDTGYLSQKSFEEANHLLLRYGHDINLKGLRFAMRGEVRFLVTKSVIPNERIMLEFCIESISDVFFILSVVAIA